MLTGEAASAQTTSVGSGMLGPFTVGEWEKLDGADLEKTIYGILHKQLPKTVKEAFERKESEGIKIVVHGYASNTGPDGADASFRSIQPRRPGTSARTPPNTMV